MGDQQYGLPDLRQVVAGRTYFEGTQQGIEPFFSQSRSLAAPPGRHHHHYESINMVAYHDEVMLPSGFVKLGHHDDNYCTNANSVGAASASGATGTTSSGCGGDAFYGVEMEGMTGWIGIGNDGGDNNNNSRWPRQETLTLLEIRSRLDSRFKEANQKGPLWDEISRIMAEEHGYQRSGKKCREKFENLHKYYKKTKEGRAGRQDGKHYRFFRQLEALYGETTSSIQSSANLDQTQFINNSNNTLVYQNPVLTISQENQEHKNKNCTDQSLSFSNTSEFETTSSSENNNDDYLSAIAYNMMNRSSSVIMRKQQKGENRKSWKGKVEDFVDSQIRRLMETQEAWMEGMLKTIEDREHERMCRQEEWTKREAARFDQEHEFWAKERAWIESRDATLMAALKKYSVNNKGLELMSPSSSSSVEQIARARATHQRHKKNQVNYNNSNNMLVWSEPEILSLVQIRTAMESRFQQSGYSKYGLFWEEIAEKMASLGYNHSVDECKQKWEDMNKCFNMTAECNKKRKEDLIIRSSNYFDDQQLESYNGHEIGNKQRLELGSSSLSNPYVGSSSSCFQAPIGGKQSWIKKNGLKLNNNKDNQQL